MSEKLKEYKELIAIIVFFLSGFIWLDTQFPTKTDLKAEKTDLKTEIESLSCLLEKYMTLTQLQIRGQELENQIRELEVRITGMLPEDNGSSTVTLSPAMKREFDELDIDFKARKDALHSNSSEMEKIRDELGRQICRGVGS